MERPPFEKVMEVVYWFLIFLSPFLFFTFLGVVLFLQVKEQSTKVSIFIGLSVLGASVGILWAESIRKKTGCTEYMGKILGTSDSRMDKKKKENS